MIKCGNHITNDKIRTSISFVICLFNAAVHGIVRKLISFGNKAVKTCKKNSVPEYPYVQLGILMCTFGTNF